MSGGKGGSQSTTVEIPDWLEGPAKRTLARAESVADIGYAPYYGPEVAAFSPDQQAAFDNTNAAAAAFGLDAGGGGYMPQTTQMGGARGYSSIDGYTAAIAHLAKNNPEIFAALNGDFRAAGDPYNTLGGMREMTPFEQYQNANSPPGFDSQQERAQAAAMDAALAESRGLQSDRGLSGLGGGFGFGGYTGIGDMFDGGGPGASGGAFSGGGLLSSAANRVTRR